MKDGITLKEAKECKTEAEKKILAVLTDLHEDTGCVVSEIKFASEEMLIVGGGTTQTFNGLHLRLEF